MCTVPENFAASVAGRTPAWGSNTEAVTPLAKVRSELSEALSPRSSTAVPASGASPSSSPLRRWIWRAVVGDLVAALAAVYVAAILRFGVDSPGRLTAAYTALAIGVTLGWPLIGTFCGTYELRPSLFGVEELRRVLRSGLYLAAALGMAHFLFKLDLSRLFVALLIPLVVSITGVWRMILRARSSRWTERGTLHQAVALGSAAQIADLRHQMRTRTRGASPIEIIAYVADDLDPEDPVPPGVEDLRRLPNRDAIMSLAREGVAIDLLVRAGRPEADEMARLTQRAHEVGAWVAVAPHRHDTTANAAVSYMPLGSTPLLVVETPALRPSAAFVKAAMDRALALVFVLVLSPLLLFITVAIAVQEGRPVLYRQQRVGKDGHLFTCLKFRTMRFGAESELPALLDSNEHDGPLFKIRNDPRITDTGRRLRKHSLDELPQFVNVLRGEMSLVGPRPVLPSEVTSFDARTARRLLVKPGITGLWQVEGRSDLPWDEGVYLDLMYVDHWSPLLDGVIIARTVRAILLPEGAY